MLAKSKLFRKNYLPLIVYGKLNLSYPQSSGKQYYQFNHLLFIVFHQEWQNLEMGGLKCFQLCKNLILVASYTPHLKKKQLCI